MWINGSLECGWRPLVSPTNYGAALDEIPAALDHPPSCAEMGQKQMKWACHLNLFLSVWWNPLLESTLVITSAPLLIGLEAVSSLMINPSSNREKDLEVSGTHHHYPSHATKKYAILGACYLSLSHTVLHLLFLPEKKNHLLCEACHCTWGTETREWNAQCVCVFFKMKVSFASRMWLIIIIIVSGLQRDCSHTLPWTQIWVPFRKPLWSSSTRLILKRWALLALSLGGGGINRAFISVIPGLVHLRNNSVWAPDGNWQCDGTMLRYWFSALCCWLGYFQTCSVWSQIIVFLCFCLCEGQPRSIGNSLP